MKTLLLLFLFTIPYSISTTKEEEKKLFVSEISGGPILLQQGKEKTTITEGQQISKKDIIIISEGGTMILLEPLNCDRYTLKGPYTGNINGYMKRNKQNSVRHISKTYFNFLFAQMLSPKESYREKDETSSTSALRKSDSILISCDTVNSSSHISDSLTALSADTMIISPITSSQK